MTFGARLRRYRLAQGLTQKALSRLAQIRQAEISELETGKIQDPKGTKVFRLAQALGIAMERLYGESDPDLYVTLIG